MMNKLMQNIVCIDDDENITYNICMLVDAIITDHGAKSNWDEQMQVLTGLRFLLWLFQIKEK